jgi:membrane-associated protease RseP (regulator of RpoE activity)
MVAACVMVGGVGGCQSALAGGPTTNLSSSNAGVPANLIGTSVGEQHWFGVAVENLPPAISRQLKLQDQQGLMIMAVLPQSPAERSGLRANDLLIEIDGRPLTTQNELARAANALEETKNGVIPKVSHLTFLREGTRNAIDIMPEVRPDNMLVLGKNLASFTGALPAQRAADAEEVRNYVLPNGAAAQIGPGYRVNLDAGDTVTVKSIRSIMDQGKTVILARETDPAGAVRNTITVDGKSYVVEPGKVELLPPELRPLGEQLLAGTQPGQIAVEVPADPRTSLDQRVKELETQNAALQKQVEELAAELKKNQRSAAK